MVLDCIFESSKQNTCTMKYLKRYPKLSLCFALLAILYFPTEMKYSMSINQVQVETEEGLVTTSYDTTYRAIFPTPADGWRRIHRWFSSYIPPTTTGSLPNWARTSTQNNIGQKQLRLQLQLDQAAQVDIQVKKPSGELVLPIIQQNLEAGNYHFDWNAKREKRGTYLFHVQVNEHEKIHRIIVRKDYVGS